MKHVALNSIAARLTLLAIAAAAAMLSPVCAMGAPNRRASEIARDSRAARATLVAQNPAARGLGRSAAGVLVFPSITRAGFIFGGQAGEGTLFRRDGSIGGFFRTTGASWGLQAGIQNFGYALFLMDNNAVQNLERRGGWDIGSSPSLVVVDRGMASAMNTTTIRRGTYAFFFNQRGLMAGLGLKGSKITRINPR